MGERLRNMTSIYLIRDNNVLLLFRQGGRVVNHVWTGSAGGHFEEGELNDPESCVLREMREELGIEQDDIENLQLHYVTLRRTGEEIRQNYYYFADLKKTFSKTITSNEGLSKWFPINEINELPMPYSAKYVVEHFIETGRFSSDVYVGIADGYEVKFVALPEYG